MYACPTVLMFEHFHVSPLRAMMYRRVCNVCVRVCVCVLRMRVLLASYAVAVPRWNSKSPRQATLGRGVRGVTAPARAEVMSRVGVRGCLRKA